MDRIRNWYCRCGYCMRGGPALEIRWSVMAAGRDGAALVVGGRGGGRAAFGAGMDGLLAQGVILAAGNVSGALEGAEALLHGIGFFAAEDLGGFEAAGGVEIVAEYEVFGRLLLAVVEVVPGADHFTAVGSGEDGVDAGKGDAFRGGAAPDGNGLAAMDPAGVPDVLGAVVVERGEVGGGSAFAAVVVERADLGRADIGELHPVEPAEMDAFQKRRDGVRGEGRAPDVKGVGGGRGLRAGAHSGDDESGVVKHSDFADGGPFFGLHGARHPGDDVLLILSLGVEVHPAEGILLGAKGPA